VAPHGTGPASATSGYWADPDLAALLWSYREAEIIQAAHRARPINHPVDIWLLTNIPIWELPPDELLTMREILAAPEGVNVFEWDKFVIAVAELCRDFGMATKEAIMEVAQLSGPTASKYMDLLEAGGGWERAIVPSQGPGRPARAISQRP